jgi:hypothetical protein
VVSRPRHTAAKKHYFDRGLGGAYSDAKAHAQGHRRHDARRRPDAPHHSLFRNIGAGTPSFSTPTLVANPQLQGGLIALDPCDGTSGVCVIVLGVTPIDLPIVDSSPPLIGDLPPTIDVLAPPIDVLAPPIDVLAPPIIPVTVVTNPGPPPLFPPEPLKPIPEASTWVMTITGFSIIAFTFRKRRRPRINPISIIDVSEV